MLMPPFSLSAIAIIYADAAAFACCHSAAAYLRQHAAIAIDAAMPPLAAAAFISPTPPVFMLPDWPLSLFSAAIF